MASGRLTPRACIISRGRSREPAGESDAGCAEVRDLFGRSGELLLGADLDRLGEAFPCGMVDVAPISLRDEVEKQPHPMLTIPTQFLPVLHSFAIGIEFSGAAIRPKRDLRRQP
jgi:hypothetical protein